MNSLDLARWQFGITTVYHFLFIPLTIGLSVIVAGFQTMWVRTNDVSYLRLTKFYGKLFLINFAMGVVTGIVQEFQFGMNWSDYSRFVGDVFGAPLAIEGLLAFFLESTFLGLWIFGWDKLPRKIHLACIWIAALGTVLSAYFILAANSWMQHPIGYRYNAHTHRAELHDFPAVLTNSTTLITAPHTLAACLLTSGGLVVAVALWHLLRKNEIPTFRMAAKVGAWVTLVGALGLAATGDIQGKIMTEQQPMKMAAAEALYHTEKPASFSLFTIGSLDGQHEIWAAKVPHLLSFLATGSVQGQVRGIDDLKSHYVATYGPANYTPIIPITYWSFRLMIGLGMFAALLALVVLWSLRKGRSPASRWFFFVVLLLPFLPLVANSFGWIFTEMGRQPWVVFGLMRTSNAVSPGVSGAEVLTSLMVFTLLYGVLAVVEARLMISAAKKLPPAEEPPEPGGDSESDRPPTFAY